MGPYADKLTMLQFADSTARLNALLGGTVDHIDLVEAGQTEVVKSNADFTLLQAKSGGWEPITMRIDQKPFDDVRVRQAFRLIADRQQMIDQALAGYGWLGNDMYGQFDPGYPKDLPQREQDIEQAKSLLKQAGYDNDLTVDVQHLRRRGRRPGGRRSGLRRAGQGGRCHDRGQEARRRRVLRRQLLEVDVRPGLLGHTQLPAPDHADHVARLPRTTRRTGRTTSGRRSSMRHSRRSTTPSATSSSPPAQTIEYERGGLLVWQGNILLDAYSNKLTGVIPDSWGQSACKNRYNLMSFV